MISLRQAIDRISERQRRIQDPAPFFRRHAAEWRRRAAASVRLYGRPLRPAEISREQWEHYLDDLAERVGLLFVLADGDGEGVDIDLWNDSKDAEGEPARQPLTMADILAWVMAGPDDGGKNLTAEEQAMDPEAVAARVWFARRRGASQLDRPIRRYLMASQTTAGANILDAILKGWLAELRPVIAAHYRAWVHEIAALK